MKISLNWLKTILPIDKTPEEIEAILTATGLEVEHFEAVESVKGGLKGLIVGEVVECEKHPNADKLNLTKVNTGSGELLSIVCGAPNVRKGIKVIVAPVGTTVYPINGEPFKIQKAKIRGEQSEGMLCADDEIGLGESHAGLRILEDNVIIGRPLTEIFEVESDVIFEIGLTANRGDAASHYGVARELATVLDLPLTLHSSELNVKGDAMDIQINIADTNDCPRYSGVIVDNIKVGESPEWLQNRLKSIGLKPINNVVDTTNYILHELGQPLHAFDYDQIKGKSINVRKAKADTKFVTLDGMERTLKGHELMIENAEHPMCIAGVYGGLDSGVSENTTKIFLESAYFSPDTIRKAAKSHNISTDSSFRFERGTDPDMTIVALKRAVAILSEICGANAISQIIDRCDEAKIAPAEVVLKYSNIKRIVGIEIPISKVKQIILGLGINIISESETELNLSVPRFKSDVTREIDVIEEIIRIHGFEHIPLQQHLRMSLNYKKGGNLREIEMTISQLLRGIGYREIMTNSLSSDKHYDDKSQLVYLSNPLSAEMNVMRQSMLFGALESIAYNKNRKQENTRFFEFGKVYQNKEKGFKEKEQLLIIASGKQSEESWETQAKAIDQYYIKSVVARLGRSFKNSNEIAETGKIDKKTLQAFGIKDDVYYAIVDWTKLKNSKKEFKLKPIPTLPSVRRDLSLVLDKTVEFKQIQDIVNKYGGSKITTLNAFDVYEGKPLEQHQKSISISIELYDDQKTLTDKEIDPVIDQLIGVFESELKAIIRK